MSGIPALHALACSVLAPRTIELRVRPVATDDVPFVLDLAQTAFQEYDRSSRSTIAASLSERASEPLLAVRGDERAGFIILTRRGRTTTWAVNAIAVATSERGKGVGRQLMRAAERHVRSRGGRKLTLCTSQSNVAALHLFLRIGFVITARDVLRYRGQQPACLLEKQLS